MASDQTIPPLQRMGGGTVTIGAGPTVSPTPRPLFGVTPPAPATSIIAGRPPPNPLMLQKMKDDAAREIARREAQDALLMSRMRSDQTIAPLQKMGGGTATIGAGPTVSPTPRPLPTDITE